MAFFFGKSGADAIFVALERVCKVLNRYEAKLRSAVAAAETGGVITSDQATAAYLFIDGARVTCAIFGLIASNSGFTS